MRRRGIRVTVRAVHSDLRLAGWMRTLGRGGAFVETRTPFPADTALEVHWMSRIGTKLVKVRVPGRVAYLEPTGMGIQFDRDGMADPQALDALVAHCLREEAGGTGSA